VTQVLDLPENGGAHPAVLDGSAACHMPDVIEMPYRPPLFGTGELGEKPYGLPPGRADVSGLVT
jgi:carboxynorspermidine decarboxylase